MTAYPTYGRIDGPIVIIGFGSIGRGTLPLIERHFDYDADQLVVIEPDAGVHTFLSQRKIRHIAEKVTRDNYRELLGNLFKDGKGFCVNLSVDTSSLDIMKLCRELGVLYIDTVVEPWEGFYFETQNNAERTNYALRQKVRDEAAANPGGTTAVSCCGANPGMVSWFVKEALLTLAQDTSSPKGSSLQNWVGARMRPGCRRMPIAMTPAARRQSGSSVRVPSPGCTHGAPRPVRSSAFW